MDQGGNLNKFTFLLGLIAWIASVHCYASPLFPDIPKKPLPAIQTLPRNGEIVLDVRSTVLSGDQVLLADNSTEIEIGVFDLAKRSEAKWQLGGHILLHVDLPCSNCDMRASWAPRTRQLLLAVKERAYLVNDDGSYSAVDLKMPGKSLSYAETDMYAISDDGQRVAFKIQSRDPGDLYSDANDPYAIKIGRYYNDLMYEDIHGSVPISVLSGGISTPYSQAPAWSPDGQTIAYGLSAGKKNAEAVVIAALNGKVIASTSPIISPSVPGDKYITNVRWSLDGKKLGFILTRYWFEDSKQRGRSTLYTMNSDGRDLKPVRFGNKDINVNAFAWSPSGQQFAFRSDSDAKKLCNFSVMFYAQTGRQPCRDAENLFVGNVDGSELKRISNNPEYRHGQLFWIQ